MVEKNPFFGATFAERKAARLAAEKPVETTKQVEDEASDVENKAVAEKKTTRKRTAKKG